MNSRRRNKLFVVMLAASLIAISIPVASALTEQSLAVDKVSLAVNTFVVDGSVTIENATIFVNSAGASAIGDTEAGAIEPTSALPTVRSALTTGNYSYQFELRETSGACPNCWITGDKLRVRVWGRDTDGSPLLTDLTSSGNGGFYLSQSAADGSTEGVTVTVDLGTNTAKFEEFDVLVDRY